jgi:two-component system phosphate regulon sensor histidine kinase PhoR
MVGKSLIWRLYLPFLLVIIIALGVITWYSSIFFHNFYLSQTSRNLGTIANLVEEQILPLLKPESQDQCDKLCKQLGQLSKTRITVIMPSGIVLADSEENPAIMENHSNRPEFIEAMEKGSGQSVRFSATLHKNMMYVCIPLRQNEKTIAAVRTSVSLGLIDEVLSSFYLKIISTAIIIAICTAVISFLISRQITKPVRKMRRIAHQFEQGRFDGRLPLSDIAELADLAVSMNQMAQQLQNRIDIITQQRNQSEAVLSSMTEGVLAVDSNGHILSINKTIADILHLNQEDVKGHNVEEIIRNADIQQFIKDAINSTQPMRTDIVLNVEGDRFFQLNGTGITDENGSRSGAVIVLNDVTEIRRLENIRKDFVANVSHELKTPITSIKGFVETLLDGSVRDPQQLNHFLEVIAKHAERLNAIIDDLLSLSSIEEDQSGKKLALKKERIKPPLAAAIELSDIKARQKQITINLSCPESLEANINSLLLEQAVFNLVDNAIKYSEPAARIQIIAQEKDNEILISVRDNGCGIEEKHLSRIFERFYVVDKSRSRRLGGTGLGLAIVKHIAQVHGGFITVESKIGEGSVFTIHLPLNGTSQT